MALTIRRAAPTDAGTIVEFNSRLAEESEGKALDLGVLAKGVAAVLADPNKGPYYLAEEGGEVVGQMQITFEWSDWRNGWLWWIQGVYCAPTPGGAASSERSTTTWSKRRGTILR